MCGYFCIRFINFILAGKTLTEYTNLFWANNFKKKWSNNFKLFHEQYLKMDDFNKIPNIYPNLAGNISNE